MQLSQATKVKINVVISCRKTRSMRLCEYFALDRSVSACAPTVGMSKPESETFTERAHAQTRRAQSYLRHFLPLLLRLQCIIQCMHLLLLLLKPATTSSSSHLQFFRPKFQEKIKRKKKKSKVKKRKEKKRKRRDFPFCGVPHVMAVHFSICSRQEGCAVMQRYVAALHMHYTLKVN